MQPPHAFFTTCFDRYPKKLKKMFYDDQVKSQFDHLGLRFFEVKQRWEFAHRFFELIARFFVSERAIRL